MSSTAEPFERLRARLTAISRRIVGSTADAEDIVQDCFFKWLAADRAALATPAAWLMTVVQRQSIDRLRQRAREAQAVQWSAELAPAIVPEPPDADELLRGELAGALARMLACLSPSERLALVLHEVLECGHADIAAVLGTTVANARQHLARARRRLRARQAEATLEEKLCRALVLRFQAALHGRDVAALVTLLADEQPMSVHAAPAVHGRACDNDAAYLLAA